MSRLTAPEIAAIAGIKRDYENLSNKSPSAKMRDVRRLLAIVDRLSLATEKGTGMITAEEINKVATLVQDFRGDVAEQLTLVAHVLIVGCKANGIGLKDLLNEIVDCFAQPHDFRNDGAPAPEGTKLN